MRRSGRCHGQEGQEAGDKDHPSPSRLGKVPQVERVVGFRRRWQQLPGDPQEDLDPGLNHGLEHAGVHLCRRGGEGGRKVGGRWPEGAAPEEDLEVCVCGRGRVQETFPGEHSLTRSFSHPPTHTDVKEERTNTHTHTYKHTHTHTWREVVCEEAPEDRREDRAHGGFGGRGHAEHREVPVRWERGVRGAREEGVGAKKEEERGDRAQHPGPCHRVPHLSRRGVVSWRPPPGGPHAATMERSSTSFQKSFLRS